MKLKLFFQSLLIATIILIIIIFYFYYLKSNQNINLLNQIDQEEEINKLDDKMLNQLTNVEYNSTDSKGNTYYLNARKAITGSGEKERQFINLEKVNSIIYLKNKGLINIYAESAVYDKNNHNTKFFNDVKIEYLDNKILSNNFDLLFTENISKIYNNVLLINSNTRLNTDEVLIDLKTGNIKLEMLNASDKIKILTKYEYNN